MKTSDIEHSSGTLNGTIMVIIISSTQTLDSKYYPWVKLRITVAGIIVYSLFQK